MANRISKLRGRQDLVLSSKRAIALFETIRARDREPTPFQQFLSRLLRPVLEQVIVMCEQADSDIVKAADRLMQLVLRMRPAGELAAAELQCVSDLRAMPPTDRPDERAIRACQVGQLLIGLARRWVPAEGEHRLVQAAIADLEAAVSWTPTLRAGQFVRAQ